MRDRHGEEKNKRDRNKKNTNFEPRWNILILLMGQI
jgi:hypothetical protein